MLRIPVSVPAVKMNSAKTVRAGCHPVAIGYLTFNPGAHLPKRDIRLRITVPQPAHVVRGAKPGTKSPPVTVGYQAFIPRQLIAVGYRGLGGTLVGGHLGFRGAGPGLYLRFFYSQMGTMFCSTQP
jgi:hypothetical protein